MIHSGILLLFFASAIVAFEGYRYRRGVRFDPFFFFSAWFAASYCVAPFLLAIGDRSFVIVPSAGDRLLDSELPLVVATIVIGYLASAAGYHAPLAFLRRYRLRYEWTLRRSVGTALLLGMTAIGVAAVLFHAHRYGGLMFVIENVSAIRSAAIPRDTLGAGARLFASWLDIATWIVFAVVSWRVVSGRRVGMAMWAGVIVMTALTLGNALLSGGRQIFLSTFVMFFLIYSFQRGHIRWRYLVPLVPVLALIILHGKTVVFQTFYEGPGAVVEGISRSMDASSGRDVLGRFAWEFSHPVLSLAQAHEAAGVIRPFRWFWDLVAGVVFFLRAVGVDAPLTVTYVNTELLLGKRESIIPPGLLASLWYNLAMPGVVIGCLAYGAFGKVLDRAFRGLTSRAFGIPVYLYIGFRYGNFVFNGDPRVYIMNLAPFFLFLAVYVLVGCRVYLQRIGPSPGRGQAVAPAASEAS